MAGLTHRLQLLLDEEQYHRVAAKASRERTSVAAVIRHAIDRDLGVADAERAEGMRRFLAAEPADYPDDPTELKREIAEMHDRRMP